MQSSLVVTFTEKSELLENWQTVTTSGLFTFFSFLDRFASLATYFRPVKITLWTVFGFFNVEYNHVQLGHFPVPLYVNVSFSDTNNIK